MDTDVKIINKILAIQTQPNIKQYFVDNLDLVQKYKDDSVTGNLFIQFSVLIDHRRKNT